MGPIRYIVYLFPILTIAALLGFFLWYAQTMRAPWPSNWPRSRKRGPSPLQAGGIPW